MLFLFLIDYNRKVIHRLPELKPSKQVYKEMTEKRTKKIKGGQKLT